METTINEQLTRVALYARVSTEEQRDGHTIDSQVTELERFAKERGWIVAGVYKDEGWSGALLDRPELDRLRDAAAKGLFQAVLLNDVDRLARDVTHLGIVKRDLERRGVRLIFRKLPSDNSPTSNLMLNVLGSFAEFEREMIADRMRRGRRHKVEVRQEFLGARAPYGLHYIPKAARGGAEGLGLEINPEEAGVLRQMFQWVDEEGLSARQVVFRLDQLGVPTRTRCGSWPHSTVQRILRDETYAGVWHYGKYEAYEPERTRVRHKYRRYLKVSRRKRPKAEWLPVILPKELQLVPRDRWERVQAQLDRNRAFSKRNSKHLYLLTGLVRCGGCGARLVGHPSHGRFYYLCIARCKNLPSVKEERLDQPVWEALQEAILHPELIAQQVEAHYEARARDAAVAVTEVDELKRALGQVDLEERRILEAYRSGVLALDQLEGELATLKARREPIQTRISALQDCASTPDFPHIKRAIADSCGIIALRLRNATFALRRQLLQLIVQEAVFEGQLVRVRAQLPTANTGRSGAGTLAQNPFGEIATIDMKCDGRNPADLWCESEREPITIQFEIIRPVPPRYRRLQQSERIVA